MGQYNEQNIKLINEHQHAIYGAYEERIAKYYLNAYSKILETVKTVNTGKEIKILDIGGASGYFAMELYHFFEENNCKVVVLDTVKYDTWSTFSDKIEFVESSVDDIDTLFGENSLDIVFANYAFHHFVRKTWKETTDGMKEIIEKIHSIVKPGGYFFIRDHFYNGFLYDKISSKIIYTLTSCKIPVIKKICQKLGAESAGVGVCFLSRKMWIQFLTGKGFKTRLLVNKNNPSRLKIYEKILLCNKSIQQNNIMICEKIT